MEIDEAAAHEAEAVGDVRARLQAHIDQLEAALSASHAETTAATAAAERALRDARSSQQEMERASATARHQMATLEATINDLHARSRALHEERDAAERKVRVGDSRSRRCRVPHRLARRSYRRPARRRRKLRSRCRAPCAAVATSKDAPQLQKPACTVFPRGLLPRIARSRR